MISPITLSFGPVEFSCRFSGFGPTFMRIMRFDVKPKLERKQISPKSQMQIAQDKQPAEQNIRQNAAFKGRRRPGPPVGTTGGPWSPPRPARGGSSSAGCGGFSFDASNAHAFIARLLLVFAFKRKNESGSKGTHCS